MAENTINSDENDDLRCCVKNCQKKVSGEPIKVGEKSFCKVCGTAYYRSLLGL